MAKLGDLVVNIGANTSQFNKDLKKVRRELRQFGSGFKKLGEDMTKTITLPLTALGALAVKSASDLETLETSFISLTGGAKQAANMMQQLNEFTAKTPFQIDAVAGAARQLVASGTEISEVNNQLQFLGDIAATSGSEINDIAAIFAKVNAKGKVELENLNQLAERGIPIFTALSESTGLLPSELGAGAVSVEEFNKTLKSFADEGGFAEGAMARLSQTAAGKFSTALDNLKLAGAELAKSLMPVLKDIIDFVTRMAQKFVALDDDTKKLILAVGGFVAAIGPVLIIMPKVIAQTKLLAAALKGLNPAYLAIGAGVAIATSAWNSFMKKAENVEDTIKDLNKQIAQESIETKILFDRVKDVNLQEGNRQKALNKLQELYPDYLSNLDLNKSTLKDIEDAERNVITAISDRVKAQVQASAQAKLLEAQVNLTEKLLDAELNLRDEGFDPVALKMFFDKINNQVARLAAGEIDAVDFSNFFSQLTERGLGAEIGDQLDIFGISILPAFAKAIEDANRRLELINSTMSDTGEIVEDTGEDVEESGTKIKKTIDESFPAGSLGAMNEELSKLKSELDSLIPGTQAFFDKMQQIEKATFDLALATGGLPFLLESLMKFGNSTKQTFEEVDDTIARTTESMNNAIAGVAQGFIESSLDMVAAAMVAGQPIQNFGANLVGAFGELAQQLGKIAIGFGITVDAIKEKLLKNPKLAVVAGVALLGLGKLASAAADKAISENMPALAEGGLAFGPTTALVGDNRNASIDPEVIAPLSKLRDMLGGSTSVHGRISGDDILISNSRAMRDRNRFA